MNAVAPQSPSDAVPRGILGDDDQCRSAVFYFCNARPGVAVLGQMLEAVTDAGRRALVLTRTRPHALLLSRGLWSYRRAAFLPHGVDGPSAHLQPILISHEPFNANGADVLVLPDGEQIRDLSVRAGDEFAPSFRLILIALDATDPQAVAMAGRSWTALRGGGYETFAFEREAPAAARRSAAPVRIVSDLDSPVPLRWHRTA
jgi:DNA polymerase IIIc chi subunit